MMGGKALRFPSRLALAHTGVGAVGALVACAVLGCSLFACGPAVPPPRVAAPPPPSPARLAKKLDASLAALSLPEDLLLAGRWKNPSALLGQLESWSGGKLSLESWLRTHLGEPSRPIDLNAPIEVIVVLDRHREPPALSWALSLGLGPASAVKATSEPTDVESPLGLSCAESKALGPAAARMVCAPSDDQLARLLPHATRALPLAPVGEADIAVSVRAAPLSGQSEERLRALASAWLASVASVSRINDRFDAQWANVVDGVARELRYLAEDLDGSSLEFSLRAKDQALELSLLAPAAAGRSALGQLVVGSGASGLAPEEFWQAHEASDGAGFSWAFQPAPLARLREPLAALLGTVLDYRGVPNRLEQQARELVLYLPMPRGPVIHASGRLPPPGSPREKRAAWLEALGWQLYSVRGNFAEYQYYVGALAKAFADPILGPQLGRLIRSGFGPSWVPAHLQQRRPRSGDLPRGSFVLEVGFAAPNTSPMAGALVSEFPGDSAGGEREGSSRGEATNAARAPELFMIFVPDEDGVRIAWGADERFLSSLLVQRARSKASGTLAGRAGLGALNEHRILAGGFFSLAGLEEFNTGSLEHLQLWNGPAKQIERAPHRGVSPIVYALSQPSEAWLHLTTRIGRETLEDLLFLIGTAPDEP
jgi:hypothetical protein